MVEIAHWLESGTIEKMLMKDCITDIDHVSMRALERTRPEEEWVTARQSGFLPASAFELYRLNSFLSFGSAPSFLKDDDNVLFSYFALVLRSVMESFLDAGEQRKAFGKHLGRAVVHPELRVGG